MTLKRKLLATTGIATVLVVVVSVFLAVSARQVTVAGDNAERATKIVDAISQVRFSTFEHLLHHDQRSLEQWRLKHGELPALLRTAPSTSPEDRATLADIGRLSREVEVIFNRLVASYNTPLAQQGTTAEQDLQERLATQLLIKQQTQITDALTLAANAHDQVARINQRASMLAGAVIAMMLSITLVNFVFMTRTITRSLKGLQQGAEAVAAGKFDYRIVLRNHDDEFGRVAEAFNTMALATGQLDKAKSEFILLASHQLRTPLTAVKWYAKALITPDVHMTPRRQQQYTKQIFTSNERMIELVNKLLEACRVETDSLSPLPENIYLEPLCKQVLADAAQLLRDNDVTVTKRIDKHLPAITIDPAWLRAIVHNLLSNAIRYSRHGGRITLGVQQAADGLVLSVKDSGYGIPADQRDKIFTRLFRADNAKQVIGEGSGLDLYITKSLVERVGGKIWFTSIENRGTTFYVALPIAGNKPASDHRAKSAA